jgi:hypothetical protein
MYDGTGSVFFKKRTVRTSSCRCMASCSNMRVTPGVPFFSTVSFVMLFQTQTRVNASIPHVSSNLYLVVLVIISISFALPSPFPPCFQKLLLTNLLRQSKPPAPLALQPSRARRQFALRLAQRKAALENTRDGEDDADGGKTQEQEEREGRQRFAKMFEGIDDSSEDEDEGDGEAYEVEGREVESGDGGGLGEERREVV